MAKHLYNKLIHHQFPSLNYFLMAIFLKDKSLNIQHQKFHQLMGKINHILHPHWTCHDSSVSRVDHLLSIAWPAKKNECLTWRKRKSIANFDKQLNVIDKLENGSWVGSNLAWKWSTSGMITFKHFITYKHFYFHVIANDLKIATEDWLKKRAWKLVWHFRQVRYSCLFGLDFWRVVNYRLFVEQLRGALHTKQRWQYCSSTWWRL